MTILSKVNALGFAGLSMLFACGGGDGADSKNGSLGSEDEDAGISLDASMPDGSTPDEDAGTAPLECRTSDIPPLLEAGVNAAPRQACSDAQIQSAADCLTANDCNAWIQAEANKDCASCVFTGNELRGPYYRSADGKNTVENSAGCIALRSNDACGQAIVDSEFCLQLVCAYCDDGSACIDAALKEECLPAENVVADACTGVKQGGIARGCLAADASASSLRAVSVSIISAFCAAQP